MINQLTLYDFTYIKNTHLVIIWTVFLCVVTKLLSSMQTYKKTIYLFIFLVNLSSTIALINMNHFIAMFFLIEIGTIIFIVVITRSTATPMNSVNRYRNLYLIVPVPTVALLVAPTNVVSYIKTTPNLFMDLFTPNNLKNDFFSFYLTLTQSSLQETVSIILFFIVLTIFIIIFKQVKNWPTKRKWFGLNHTKYTVFQKNKEIFYFLKKNCLSFFKSN